MVNQASRMLGDHLKSIFKFRILGPESPLIGRLQNWYLRNILIKIEKDKSVKDAKKLVLSEVNKLLNEKGLSGTQINIDVDPQ